MASAAEAELDALYLTAKEAVYLRQILIKIRHLQPQTPIQTDNTTAEGVTNKKIQPKRTKAMDMQLHWLRDRESQDQFKIYWQPGKTNLVDYFTKHHLLPNHHTNVRAEFLMKVQYLEEARQKQLVNGQTTAQQTQIPKLQGCVSLPKKSIYVQKPTYASLANFTKGEFKSPHERFSVTKPT
jgi:hypothetical protein